MDLYNLFFRFKHLISLVLVINRSRDLEMNFRKLKESFFKNVHYLSHFCNNYPRDMILSLTPIFQKIDSYFLAGSSKRVAIIL
jgi:hypothetical protein